MIYLPLSCTIIFWPKFYYSLFKYKKGRGSICSIVTKPLGTSYRRPVRPSNQITCLNVGYYCYSFYQAKEDYSRLHKQSFKGIEYAVAAATDIALYGDPLHLEILYILFLERLPNPPDGALKSMLLLTLVLFEYLYSVVRGLILNSYGPIFASLLAKTNRNMFVRHDRRCGEKFRPIPTLYTIVFYTEDDHSEDSFSWATDDIPFVIDNYVIYIIISQRILFIVPLVPTSETL